MNLNELGNDKTIITIAGEELEVNATDAVEVTLKRILQEKGLDSFTIIVDGKEIMATADLPETFAEHEIEVKRYVKAGC